MELLSPNLHFSGIDILNPNTAQHLARITPQIHNSEMNNPSSLASKDHTAMGDSGCLSIQPFYPSYPDPSTEILLDASQNQQTTHLMPASNIWNVFDFNLLLNSSLSQSSAIQEEPSRDTRTSDTIHQKATLSIPLLIHNLTRTALCLGNGSAYPRRSVNRAIMSSIINVTA